MSLHSSGIIRILTDLEHKQTANSQVVKFYGGIAEGKDQQGQYINNAINCEVWGKQAQVITDFLGKGKSFFATGRILLNEWTAKDGSNRKQHTFKIERVELFPKDSQELYEDTKLKRVVNSNADWYTNGAKPLATAGVNDDIPF